MTPGWAAGLLIALLLSPYSLFRLHCVITVGYCALVTPLFCDHTPAEKL